MEEFTMVTIWKAHLATFNKHQCSARELTWEVVRKLVMELSSEPESAIDEKLEKLKSQSAEDVTVKAGTLVYVEICEMKMDQRTGNLAELRSVFRSMVGEDPKRWNESVIDRSIFQLRAELLEEYMETPSSK
jgi:hypothetical protein